MYDDLHEYKVDVLHHGGYYILRNVRESEQNTIFMDIYLLTDSLHLDSFGSKIKDSNENNSLAPSIKGKANSNVAVSSLRGSHNEHKQIFYEEIKNALSGYVRIIRYTNDSVNQYVRNDHHADVGTSQRIAIENKPNNLHISEVTEGIY